MTQSMRIAFQKLQENYERILSGILVVALLSQIISPFVAFASADITIESFQLNGAGSSIAINPGDSFKLALNGKNLGSDAITSVYGSVSFSDNSAFTYLENENTYIGFSQTNGPILMSDYSPSTGLYTQITNGTRTSVNANEKPKIAGTAPTNFTVTSSGSAYQYTLNGVISGIDASSNPVASTPATQTIYVNVKPHISDYYFEKADGSATTTQIQGAQAEVINLVLKVKDFNGCTNIDGGSVTADLSPLGLSSSEALTYLSCDADGKTATFKKIGITTISSLGDKTFSSANFSATDEDGNKNNPSDPYFSASDKTASIVLTVIPPAAPNVVISSVSDSVIGGPLKQSATLSFSGSQDSSVKIAIGSDGSCNSGTTLVDWTASGSYLAYTASGITIASTSLSVGSNVVYVCMKNAGGTIGSASTTLTKDVVAPVLSSFTLSPSNIILNDSTASFVCSEDGYYQIEIGGTGTTLSSGTFASSGSVTTGVNNHIPVVNGILANGSNTIHVYCVDQASNFSHTSGSITKTPPTPSMAGQVVSFSDNDFDYDGLDGRDMSLTWNSGAVAGFNYFESYRIYLLPSTTTFNTGSQTYIALVTDKNATSWVGTSSITKDSLGAALVSGASYKICMAILGTSGMLGTEGCSSAAVLTADSVSHPSVLSARFTSDTNLELTTDATLDTAPLSHSGSLISFVVGSTTYTGVTIASINGTKLNVTIPSLGNPAATGTGLLVLTGAIRANGGGYNNYVSNPAPITDAQVPVISAFSKTTPPQYGSFYKGDITLNYTFSEGMSGGGNTRISITRTSGNADGTNHAINLTAGVDLSTGAHSKTIDLDSLSLVSGTTYQIQIIGKDIAGNSTNSAVISGIGYDNHGPSLASLTALNLFSTLTPTLTWLASVDDSGNGSGVQKYVLQVYTGNTCSLSNIQTFGNIAPSAVSQVLSTLPADQANYSWNLTAIDNMGNTGATASCAAFKVDTTIPAISNATITDQTIGSTSYTKNGDSLNITANIPHTDANHIWINIDSLAGGSGYSDILCSSASGSVSCSYSAGLVTFSFAAGFAGTIGNGVRQISLRAQNISGGNEQTAIASITADNTAPSMTSSTLTSPNGGENWGGTTRTITWNSSSITDSIGVNYIRLEYATGAGTWNLIGTGVNNGSYSWNIVPLQDRSDYQVRITAFDHVGNSASDTSDAIFTIDKVPPTVPSNTLSLPNGGVVYAGGQSLSITWNSGAITDNTSLPSNPITLAYSTDSGTNWTQIATNLPNSGTHNWTVPTLNIAGGLVKLTVTDLAGNTASDQSDTVFVIDSTSPVQTIAYAGNGGSTPQNGRKINSSGMDISASSTDNYLSRVEYQFANTSDSLYWNATATGWTGMSTWNVLCSDGKNLGTNGACSSINATIVPTILDGKNYTLVIRSIDEAGNTTTSITHSYVGDTIAPNLSVNPVTTAYLSGSLTFTGTASDTGSSISSVKIQIQKGTSYWDGNAWVSTPQSLLVSTSDTYANWSYNFMPSLVDEDGQTYQVSVTAYDGAYRTNNSTTLARTAVKDITGPSIDANIFTFSTGGIRKGNTQMNVTWNPALITTSGATLAANPITLAYNFTGSVVTLATGLPNSGSYSFSLPVVDSTTAKIIITATDVLGNNSANVASSNFSIDSTPPSVLSTQTLDQSAAGKIDSLLVHFSEEVQNIDQSAFLINSGALAITGWSWGGVVSNHDTIVLSFASTGSSASTPTLSFTASGASDIAGNSLTAGSITSIDGAAPRITGTEIYDTDVNGKFDQIQVHFSEPLASSTTLTGWTLVGAPIGTNIIAVNSISNTLILSLSEGTYTTDSTGITLSLNNSAYTDIAGNLCGNFSNTPLVDKASPVLISVTTQDKNDNAKIDSIVATFSESLSGSTAGFSFSGLALGSSYTGTATLLANSITFTLSETSLASDGGQTPLLSYTLGNIQDTNGNVLALINSHAIADGVAPRIFTRATKNLNGNGKIDAIEIGTSEDINKSFSGVNVVVSGYTVSGFDATCSGTISDNHTFCVSVTEKAVADTSVTPNTQIVSNTSLADNANNLLPIESSSVVTSDAVGPVIIGARYDAGGAGVSDDKLYLTFSESISGATISSNPSNDFVLASGGSFGTTSVTTINSPTTLTISLGSDATALVPGISKIGINTATLADTLGNNSPVSGAQNMVTLSPAVVINEVMWSATGSKAYQYVELRNLGFNSANITGWTIKNAGGNGIDITLPSATIPANGFYLITSVGPGVSPLAVSPDDIDPTLSLDSTAQNNLVLMNGAIVVDSALANPWPKGNNIIPASMERMAFPGDGLDGANWYQASANVGFDAGISAYGTPGSANVFDSVAPTIGNVTIADNTLFAIGSGITLSYTYSDNVALDIAKNTFTLEKWNGSSYTDVTNASVSSSGMTSSGANITFNTLSFGKYKANITIFDTAGNSTIRSTIFFVDKLEMTISTPSVNIGTINPNSITYAPDVTVTVKTLGAGISLTLGGSGAMNSGINTLPSWSGAIQGGFGFDYSESGSGSSVPLAGTLRPINPTVLSTYATGSIDANGLQKTYVYTIRYGGKVAGIQTAGQYSANTFHTLLATY